MNREPQYFREEMKRVETPSRLAPEPGAESAGPAMFDLVKQTNRSIEVQNQLLRAAIPLMDKRIVINYATGQTDGSGVLDLVLYRVPQGMQFITTRLNIEAVGFTPATPYTNAAGWIALMKADKFVVGSMIDFLPNPPVASGAILPASITDGATEAGVFRGGEVIGFHIAGGPATTDIYCRVQGIEEPL